MVSLYYTDIRPLASMYDAALSRITPARRQRIAALKQPDDRLRSLGAGLLLRAVLEVKDDTQLTYGAQGKPQLPGGPQISLSHSGTLAVLAVSPLPVGADVQHIRPVRPAVVRYVCTPEELCWLQAGDEALRFAVLWTRKESVMKATGLGLQLQPSRLCVLPGAEPCPAEGTLWHLEHQELGGHILAAAGPEPPALTLHRLDAKQLL